MSDMVYCVLPMPMDLAETIRKLRRDHGLSYGEVGYFLCETNPDAGFSLGLGKALAELAARHLGDEAAGWK